MSAESVVGTPERSKLAVIEEALAQNPRFEVVARFEKHGNTDWMAHSVEILVARKEVTFNPNVLQQELEQLIPIESTAQDPFWPRDGKAADGYSLGTLTFDEVLGTRREDITTTVESYDDASLEKSGIKKAGTTNEVLTHDITRRIWVRLYPSIEIAEAVADALKAQEEGQEDQRVYLQYRIQYDQIENFFPHLRVKFQRDIESIPGA